MRTTSEVCLLAAILSVYAAESAAQSAARRVPIAVEGQPSCSDCEVRLERVTILQLPDSADAWISPYNIVENSRGELYVSDPFGRSIVRKFDSTGRFIGNVNRRGQGPGEFTYIYALAIDTRDQLHVYGNGHAIYARSGSLIKSSNLPAGLRPMAAVSVSADEVILVGPILGGSVSTPIHVVSATSLSSIGSSESIDLRAPFSVRLFAGAAGKGEFWTGTQREYNVELWSAVERRLITQVRRTVDWFVPWHSWDSRSDRRPPPTRLIDAVSGESGLLYTIVSIPDARWRPAPTESDQIPSAGELSRRMDSMIEVLDVRRGIPIASTRFDGVLLRFVGREKVAQLRELESGEVVVEVLRIKFHNPRRR